MTKIYLDTITRGAIPVKFVSNVAERSHNIDVQIIGEHGCYSNGEVMEVSRITVVTLVGKSKCRQATSEQLLQNKV